MANDNKRVSLGRGTVWEVDEEITERTGIISRLTMSITPEQAELLVDYLSNEANYGKYGAELEMSLFQADDDKPFIASGSLQEKYKKDGGGNAKAQPSTKGRSGGRRSL